MNIKDAVWVRHNVLVQDGCPYGPMHGGCHYPDCPQDCEGRKIFLENFKTRRQLDEERQQ